MKTPASSRPTAYQRTGRGRVLVPKRKSQLKGGDKPEEEVSNTSGKKRKAADEDDDEDEDDEPVAHKKAKPAPPVKSTYTGTMRQAAPYSVPQTKSSNSRPISARFLTPARMASPGDLSLIHI